MKYVGYHMGHDSSIAIIDDKGNLEFYAQSERYEPRFKCMANNIGPILASFPYLFESNEEYIFTSTYSFEESFVVEEYDETLVRQLKSNAFGEHGRNSLHFIIDHHLAHTLSSWLYRNSDEEKLFISFDGCGPTADFSKPLKSSLVGLINQSGFKKLNESITIPTSIPVSHLLGVNTPGKAMGLSGYIPSKLEFNKENFLKLINSTMNYHNFDPCFPHFNNPSQSDLEFISGFYNFIIEEIWEKLKQNIEKHKQNRGIVLSGGTALALELNTRVSKYTNDIVFCPPINDTGLCLGAAAFGYFHANKNWPNKINTPAINDIQKSLPQKGPQEPKDIAKIISQNKIVGLIRGKSEAGPRALGFRSIFAEATKHENLKIVSEDIKGREFYRPVAPIVTSEEFDKYFIGPKGEYMQYKCECTKECQKYLPAVVHRDLSARPQVVYKEKDSWLHEILTEYGRITGHQCFINTSLNKAGKPICNTYEDAESDMDGKGLSLISIPEQANRFSTKIKL
jgi:carbamoyltransferase